MFKLLIQAGVALKEEGEEALRGTGTAGGGTAMPPTVPSLLHTLRRDGCDATTPCPQPAVHHTRLVNAYLSIQRSRELNECAGGRPSAFFPDSSSNVPVSEPSVTRKSSDAVSYHEPPGAELRQLQNAPSATLLAAPPPLVSQVAGPQSGFAFPNCRTVLWDSSEQGPTVFIGVEDVLPEATVPAHVLAHLQGALAEDGASPGTLRSTISTDGNESLRYEVQEYVVPGRSDETQSDGVLLTISNAQLDPSGGRSEREAAVRARLADRSPTSVDALFQPHFAVQIAQPSGTSDQFRLCVSAELSAPSATVVATPIRSLRVLPTPLSKSLAAAQSVRTLAYRSGDGCKARADDMQAGYVTIDACRRCVAMHVSDARTWDWPMVGVWVSDVDSVYDSLVWAACTRFCHCDSISERVAQNGAFLLLLYARGQHSPQMYEWRLSPTVAESGATPLQFECFKAPLELPLSALRSDAAAGSPFVFSLGRAIPRGARGNASSHKHHKHTSDGAQATAPGSLEAAATMLCPEPQALPSPATLSFVAATSSAGQPPAWSPLHIRADTQPISLAGQTSLEANPLQTAPASLLPTEQVAAQQATIDRLENTVRLLQQQVATLSKNVHPPTVAPTPSEHPKSAATNTSFLWQNEATQPQLNQDVPPRAMSTESTNTATGFSWQQRQPDGTTSAELQTAMSRFAESVQATEPAMPSGRPLTIDVDTASTTGETRRTRVCVEPVLSPARSARAASTYEPAQTSSTVAASVDCTTSSDDDGQFADRHDAVGGAPSTPARFGRGFQLPSASVTPPSPPEPVWRSMANYCADLNVSTIGELIVWWLHAVYACVLSVPGRSVRCSELFCVALCTHYTPCRVWTADIPRVRLPDSLTLPEKSGDEDEDEDEDEADEADKQHVSAEDTTSSILD